MLSTDFMYVAALIIVAGDISYLTAVLKGEVQPNRVTWFLWALMPLIAFVAQLDEGVGIHALTTFVVGFGPVLIFTASFLSRQAQWRIGWLDISCGVLSLIGLALWFVTQSGILAIVLMIVADALAAVPTVVKAFRYPRTESAWTFWMAAVGAGITTATIDQWDVAHAAFGLYILAVATLLGALITFRVGERLHGWVLATPSRWAG